MKKITQEEFDELPTVYGYRQCPGYTDYSAIKTFRGKYVFGDACQFGALCKFEGYGRFGGGCSFGSYCEFGEGCAFGTLCAFGDKCRFREMCRFGGGCWFGDGCEYELKRKFSFQEEQKKTMGETPKRMTINGYAYCREDVRPQLGEKITIKSVSSVHVGDNTSHLCLHFEEIPVTKFKPGMQIDVCVSLDQED